MKLERAPERSCGAEAHQLSHPPHRRVALAQQQTGPLDPPTRQPQAERNPDSLPEVAAEARGPHRGDLRDGVDREMFPGMLFDVGPYAFQSLVVWNGSTPGAVAASWLSAGSVAGDRGVAAGAP